LAILPWQERLSTYQTDPDAAIKELLRTKRVAEARAAQGQDISAQQDWANKIRAAAGLGAEYGPGVTAKQAGREYGSFQREKQISDILASLSKSRPTFTAREAERSPEYKAARQLAERQTKRDVATIAEQLNALGIASSSSMGTGAERISRKASDRLAMMVPGIIQNRLAQINQERAEQFNLLNALASLQSGERSFGLQEASLTGQYQGSPTQAARAQALQERQYEASPEAQSWYLDQAKRLGEAKIVDLLRPPSTGRGLTTLQQIQLDEAAREEREDKINMHWTKIAPMLDKGDINAAVNYLDDQYYLGLISGDIYNTLIKRVSAKEQAIPVSTRQYVDPEEALKNYMMIVGG